MSPDAESEMWVGETGRDKNIRVLKKIRFITVAPVGMSTPPPYTFNNVTLPGEEPTRR
jgi:hypothetical protein